MNSEEITKGKALLAECEPAFVADCSNDAYSPRGKEAAIRLLSRLREVMGTDFESECTEDVFLDACVITSVAGPSAKMRGLAKRVRSFSEEHFPEAFHWHPSPKTQKEA